MAPIVSVIIPARNEERNIARCLAALAENRYLAEVILVDNGSRDATVRIAESFRGALDLRVLSAPGVTISALRNRGAQAAAGRILAFLDADCVPPASWLENAAQKAWDGGLVGGQYALPPGSTWVARVWHRQESRHTQGDVPYLPGGDVIATRSAFFRIGGFDESIQTNEDCDFCRRARERGLRVQAFPELAVVHYGISQTLTGFFQRQHWHGKHVLRVFLRQPRKSQNGRAVAFAAYTALCFLLCATALLARAWLLAALAVGGLSAAPLALAARSRSLPLAPLYLVYGIARAVCLFEGLRPTAWARPARKLT